MYRANPAKIELSEHRLGIFEVLKNIVMQFALYATALMFCTIGSYTKCENWNLKRKKNYTLARGWVSEAAVASVGRCLCWKGPLAHTQIHRAMSTLCIVVINWSISALLSNKIECTLFLEGFSDTRNFAYWYFL